ncbi:MAG: CAP domain-containing protein [Acidimicrobiales bacterium]
MARPGTQTRLVATLTVALALVVTAAGAGPAGALSVLRLPSPASPPPLAPAAGWQAAVNYYRAMAGEAPVIEATTWSDGDFAHARYLVETGSTGHTEDPASPFFSQAGADAGANGVVVLGLCSERQAVDALLRAPFHALGVLDPRLTATGFGLYLKPSTGQCAAVLDVLRGRTGAAPTAAVVWPGDGTTTSLSTLGPEVPDPLAGCGLASAAATPAAGVGLPLLAQLPAAPSGVVAEVLQDGAAVSTCAYDATTYTNLDAADQATGRQILAARNAAVVIPLVPLRAGSTYAVTLRSAGANPTTLAAWQFREAPATRILDTRVGNGAPAAKLGPDQSMDLQVAGRGGIPSTGVSAVALNVTVTGPTEASFLTVWPAGQARPLASNLNDVPGLTVANQVLVKLGTGGKVSLYNHLGTVDVVADVVGVYADDLASGALFNPLAPARLLDTRTGNGAPPVALGPGGTVDLTVTGRGGVPATGVTAVALNVTATDTTADGFLTVWPSGQVRPDLASSLNWLAGRTVPNLVIAGVGANGRVSLYNSLGSTDLVADVVGWYGDPGGAPPGSRLTALTPARILDTRDGTGRGGSTTPVGPGATLDLQVTNAPGSGVPGTAAAVVLNITVTEPTADSFVTVWPTGQARPLASSLNMVAGQTVPNLVVVKLGSGGKASIFNNSGSTHVVADVVGWFDPPTTG